MALIMITMLIVGCGNSGSPYAQTTQRTENSRLSIVSTIFPQYDWVRQIMGERADDVDLTLLINNRIDMHSFQPSVSDIVRVSTADMFIYVGGDSDWWVEDVLRQAVNPNMIVINLMEVLGDRAVYEEIVEGMQHDHDCDDDDDCDDPSHDHGPPYDHAHDHGHGSGQEHSHDHDDHDHDHDHDPGHDHTHTHDHSHDHHHGTLDEHVWLSLRNAVAFTVAITEALSTLDPEHAELFRANLTQYLNRLAELDAEYNEMVSAASSRTLLFADRFPFRYLVDDYGIHYYAAFPGCSAETEASFTTIIFLAEKVDELNLTTVMVTESADEAIARTIISNTASADQRILVLDSMQSANATDWQNGVTYLSIMERNLDVLREALG